MQSEIMIARIVMREYECVWRENVSAQYTGTSKKLNIVKKVNIFLSLISESETNILYRFITHRVKYFMPLFLEILMIVAYR